MVDTSTSESTNGSGTHSHTISNTHEPSKPLVVVSFTNCLKLTQSNYLSWSTQIKALLIGYDLFKMLDGTATAPSDPTSDAYQSWRRQDQLLFGALLGTLDSSLVPLVSQAPSSKDAWDRLSNTFAKPTRGHIKQIKEHLKRLTKGSSSITEYMQVVQTYTDQLALFGKPMDNEDIIDQIFDGLGDAYKSVRKGVDARDSVISFTELHEKLLNKEIEIASKPLLPTPASVHATKTASRSSKGPGSHPPSTNKSWQQSMLSGTTSFAPGSVPSGVPDQRSKRPFLGKCQWCNLQGHVVSACPSFRQQFPHVAPPRNQFNPQARMATAQTTSGSWLLDSGASHHVTNDLANLELHRPYDGTEEIIIGDGSGIGADSVSGPGK